MKVAEHERLQAEVAKEALAVEQAQKAMAAQSHVSALWRLQQLLASIVKGDLGMRVVMWRGRMKAEVKESEMVAMEKELEERLKGLEEQLAGKEKEEEVLRDRLEHLKSGGEENAPA